MGKPVVPELKGKQQVSEESTLTLGAAGARALNESRLVASHERSIGAEREGDAMTWTPEVPATAAHEQRVTCGVRYMTGDR